MSEYVHKGCHAYWLIIRDSEDSLHFYSNYSAKELQKMIDATPIPEETSSEEDSDSASDSSAKSTSTTNF